jgi:hypothetical protein
MLMQQNTRPCAIGIHSGLIRDQTNTLSREKRVVVMLKNIDAEVDGRACRRAQAECRNEKRDAFFVFGAEH